MDTFDKITKYDTVRIINGEYKGKKGMVIELSGNIYTIELDNDLDNIQIHLNDCILIDN